MADTLFHVDPRSVADAGDEFQIQLRLRKDLKLVAPKVAFVAVPNGAQRTAWAGIKAKHEGLQKGFPDAILMWPGGGIAFAEMKARDGALSEEQHVWLNWLHLNGFPVGVFRSSKTVLAWLKGLGAPVLLADAA